jgi:peroxiredoxin (alkyl hydroperoxide reductase subunit C)
MMSMMNKAAPDFEADAYVNGKITKVKLSDYKGKWLVLFFYPADFTFVCPTEIEGFADNYDKFKAKNCEIVSISEDTVYTHVGWANFDARVKKAKYPMVADRTNKVAKAYGMYNEATGNAFRGLFIINPDGIVTYEVTTNDNIGRSTEETLRILTALQTCVLCPVNWKEGQPAIKPTV